MSRTHKKCLIASSTLHLLLLAILIIGPAFLIRKEEPIDQTVLTLVSGEISDNAPQSQAAAPAPPPPQEEVRRPVPTPVPEPVQQPVVPKPEPVKQPPVEEKKPEPVVPKPIVKKPDPVVPKEPTPTPPKQEKVKPPSAVKVPVKLDLTVKTDTAAQKRAEAEQQRKAQVEEDKRFANELVRVGPNLDNKFTSGMKFTPSGIGTAGVSYNSYDAHIRSVYMNNWHPPTDMAATSSTVTVEVVILRDGTVKRSKIVKRSGVSKLDADITNLINNRVKTVGRPFPDGATESERTYMIDFNLDLKLNG